MLVIGFASETGGFEPGYQFAYVGNCSVATENKINFLRTATLLTALGDRTITEGNLLAALTVIQNTVQAKFSKGMKETRMAVSKRIPQDDLDYAQVDIICQSHVLSMPGPGRKFLVIDKTLIERDGREVEVINEKFFNYLLDVASSTYAVEDMRPSGDGGKAMKYLILGTEGFAVGRSAIASSI
jgi:hypothetical protein